MRAVAIAAVGCVALMFLNRAATGQTLEFRGICDGSGAIMLPNDSIATVDDEKGPKLRVFNLKGGGPTAVVYIPGVSNADAEPDLEAGARVGSMSLWIGSHSRNSGGKYRRERQVLLSIPVDVISARSIPQSAVRRVASLREALFTWGRNNNVPMAEAFGPEDTTVKNLAAERQGVNIEAMAYSPRSLELLIEFRNPVLDGQALIAPLRNLDAVLRDDMAEFGPPVRLLLGGREIRDMVWSDHHASFLLVVGPSGDGGTFSPSVERGRPDRDRLGHRAPRWLPSRNGAGAGRNG